MNSRPAHFTVKAWSAWAPDRQTDASWLAWAGATHGSQAPAGFTGTAASLPLPLRRRVSPIGQQMLAACLACPGAATTGRYVFASRHGEMTRTLSIIKSLAADELPSPADFSLSVHNALAGLLSIQMQNSSGHTALAAGLDSFGYGLMEAVGYLAENADDTVLLCYGDDVLPGQYSAFSEDDQDLPMVLALHLAVPSAGDDVLTQQMIRNEAAQPRSRSVAVEFLRFLLAGSPSHSACVTPATWSWQRAR
jgi:hypothetical protein